MCIILFIIRKTNVEFVRINIFKQLVSHETEVTSLRYDVLGELCNDYYTVGSFSFQFFKVSKLIIIFKKNVMNYKIGKHWYFLFRIFLGV